jgi:hypothetical protein
LRASGLHAIFFSMTHLIPATIVFISLAVAPLTRADEAPAPEPDLRPTIEEMLRGAREALESLRGTVSPWMDGLGEVLAHPERYAAPETLPNGDIVIRRKPAPLPEPRPPHQADDAPESIEL